MKKNSFGEKFRKIFLGTIVALGMTAAGTGSLKLYLDSHPITSFYTQNMRNYRKIITGMNISEGNKAFFNAISSQEIGLTKTSPLLRNFSNLQLEANLIAVEKTEFLKSFFDFLRKFPILENYLRYVSTIGPTQLSIDFVINQNPGISREQAINILMSIETAISVSIELRNQNKMVLMNRRNLSPSSQIKESDERFLIAELIAWVSGPSSSMVIADQLNYRDLANSLGIDTTNFKIDGFNGEKTVYLITQILHEALRIEEITQEQYDIFLTELEYFSSNGNINRRYTSNLYIFLESFFNSKIQDTVFRIYPSYNEIKPIEGSNSINYAIRAYQHYIRS